MPNSLMAVSIGPVQGFIAAARRTRDFWMGSIIIQECAKAVARMIVEWPRGEGKTDRVDRLVFPAISTKQQLDPIQFDDAQSQLTSDFDVSNVILCVLDGSMGPPKELAAALRGRAQDRFREIASSAAKICSTELRADWKEQLDDDTIEVFVAWVPLQDYGSARTEVMRLLGGRKSCRDFLSWAGQAGVPKSSLDARRETVLRVLPAGHARRRGLRVRPGEQLDLVGVAKRAEWGHDAIRYPSVSRISVDPWIRGLLASASRDSELGRAFGDILSTCESLAEAGVLRRRRERNRGAIEDDLGKFPWLRSFPFEGTPLYIARHKELRKELLADLPEQQAKGREAEVEAILATLQTQLRALGRAFQNPNAYAAFLVADGDRMGRTLSLLAKQDDAANKHREFSEAQSGFAVEARRMLNQDYSGACFFAGADDVLGMVAVDQCVECAHQLRELFDAQIGEMVRGWSLPHPTLSVGIAIGHFMEPLEDLLAYARHAEARAKMPLPSESARGQRDRNALAVAVHPRGGAPIIIRDNWDHGIYARLQDWTTLDVEGLLPAKAAYDLREVARRYDSSWTDAEALRRALRGDALRTLKRKRTDPRGLRGAEDAARGEEYRARVRQHIAPRDVAALPGVSTAADLRAMAEELLVGQWLAAAKLQATPAAYQTAEVTP